MVAKNANLVKSKNSVKINDKPGDLGFFILKAKKVFTKLRQAFIKALTLTHFKLDCHIQIKINALNYVIGRVLSQLISETGNWHLVTYFLRKIIPVKTWYSMHNQELLAIVESFKTWRYYLEGYKYKLLVLTDRNNLRQFINTKSLSSRQVWWAQELFQYIFQIDYCQSKAN